MTAALSYFLLFVVQLAALFSAKIYRELGVAQGPAEAAGFLTLLVSIPVVAAGALHVHKQQVAESRDATS